jgi:hypothetical protein
LDLGGIFGVGHSILENDSGYYISGVVGGGKINIVFISIDLFGNQNFVKSYGEVGTNYYDGRPGSLKKIEDTYILGGSKSFSDSSESIFMKYNSVGDTILSQHYPSLVSDYLIFNCSNVTNDSGYIFTGECFIGNYNTDVALIKTDSLGNETWRRLYGWNTADNGFSIVQTHDSGYVVGGYTYMPGLEDSGQPLVVKFDKEGNYLWNKKPGGPLDDDKAMICASADSNIITLTTYDYTTYGGGECGRINVIKLNQQGNILWNKKYASNWDGRIAGNIKLLPDSGYICCGRVHDSTHTQVFGWILRINSEGDSIWYREYAYYDHDFGNNYLYDVTPTADNGFIACGQAYADSPNNLQKIWVLKLDSLGCDTAGCDPTVGIPEEEEKGRGGEEESVVEVWPNPCSTVLSVSLRSRQSAVGSRQSAVGSQQSAVSSRQLAVGSRQSAVGSQQSAVGSQMIIWCWKSLMSSEEK